MEIVKDDQSISRKNCEKKIVEDRVRWTRERLSVLDICLWALCLVLSESDLTGPWLHPHTEVSKKHFEITPSEAKLLNLRKKNQIKSSNVVARLQVQFTCWQCHHSFYLMTNIQKLGFMLFTLYCSKLE